VYLSHELACCHISCSSCIFVYLTHWSPSLLCSNVCLNQYVPLCQGTLFFASSMQELSEPVGPHLNEQKSVPFFAEQRSRDLCRVSWRKLHMWCLSHDRATSRWYMRFSMFLFNMNSYK
jgi:hypothetical protein